MSPTVEIFADLEASGTRLDLFLTSRLEAFSRSRLQRMIKEGAVQVEGQTVKPGYRLAGGERIVVCLPGPEDDRPRPEEIPLEFLYRDDSIAVINKSPGLLVHPVRCGQGGTLVNGLLYHLGTLPETGNPLRPGIVHRLDRDTSGVMVAVRSLPAYLDLFQQFRNRTVDKEYLALVRGRPPRKEGECLFPIGRSRQRRTTMSVRYSGGRSAQTSYQVEEEFPGVSLLRLTIQTGRTHQIRVHLAQIGCPVLGDQVYGKQRGGDLPPVPRQMLHSCSLGIDHPEDRRRLKWTAPLAEDMAMVISRLREGTSR